MIQCPSYQQAFQGGIMYQLDLSGKNILILGIANHRSIAWAIAEALDNAGARLILTYQNERMGEAVGKLAEHLQTAPLLYQCDVSSDSEIEETFNQISTDAGTLWATVHSIAYANRDELAGEYQNTSREGFALALDISAYSFIPISRYSARLHVCEQQPGDQRVRQRGAGDTLP